MAASFFNRQDLFLDRLAFKWKKEAEILDVVSKDPELDRKLSPTQHPGYGVTLRRPSWVIANVDANTTGSVAPNTPSLTSTTDFYDTSYENGNYVPPTGFQKLQQAAVPFVINHVVTADFEVSPQRLSQTLTERQIDEEFIDPLIVSASEQMQAYILADLRRYAGNTVMADSTTWTNYATQLGKAAGDAASIMRTRKGLAGTGKGVLLTHQDALYAFAAAASTNFHATGNPERIQETGTWGSTKIAGLSPKTSPLIPNVDIPAQLSGVQVDTATTDAPNGSTLWTQTTSIKLKGLSAGYVIPAGTKLYFTATNSATAAAVKVLNPATKSSSGRTKVVTVVNPVTATAGGAATVVVSGPVIYDGPSRNVNITTVLDGYYVWIFGAGASAATYRPAYVVNPDAVKVGYQPYSLMEGGSVLWKRDIVDSRGLGFTVFLSDTPTHQYIFSLRSFFGTSVVAEEGVTEILGLSN